METTSRSVRLGARQARLEAEKEGADSLWFAAELETREASDPAVAPLREGERKLFSLRSSRSHQALSVMHAMGANARFQFMAEEGRCPLWVISRH